MISNNPLNNVNSNQVPAQDISIPKKSNPTQQVDKVQIVVKDNLAQEAQQSTGGVINWLASWFKPTPVPPIPNKESEVQIQIIESDKIGSHKVFEDGNKKSSSEEQGLENKQESQEEPLFNWEEKTEIQVSNQPLSKKAKTPKAIEKVIDVAMTVGAVGKGIYDKGKVIGEGVYNLEVELMKKTGLGDEKANTVAKVGTGIGVGIGAFTLLGGPVTTGLLVGGMLTKFAVNYGVNYLWPSEGGKSKPLADQGLAYALNHLKELTSSNDIKQDAEERIKAALGENSEFLKFYHLISDKLLVAFSPHLGDFFIKQTKEIWESKPELKDIVDKEVLIKFFNDPENIQTLIHISSSLMGHIMANIAEEIHKESIKDPSFANQAPLSAIVALFGKRLEPHFQKLEKMESIQNKEQREHEIQKVFDKAGQIVLNIVLPRGLSDLKELSTVANIISKVVYDLNHLVQKETNDKDVNKKKYDVDKEGIPYFQKKISEGLLAFYKQSKVNPEKNLEWKAAIQKATNHSNLAEISTAPLYFLNFLQLNSVDDVAILNGIAQLLGNAKSDAASPQEEILKFMHNTAATDLLSQLRSLLSSNDPYVVKAKGFAEDILSSSLLGLIAKETSLIQKEGDSIYTMPDLFLSQVVTHVWKRAKDIGEKQQIKEQFFEDLLKGLPFPQGLKKEVIDPKMKEDLEFKIKTSISTYLNQAERAKQEQKEVVLDDSFFKKIGVHFSSLPPEEKEKALQEMRNYVAGYLRQNQSMAEEIGKFIKAEEDFFKNLTEDLPIPSLLKDLIMPSIQAYIENYFGQATKHVTLIRKETKEMEKELRNYSVLGDTLIKISRPLAEKIGDTLLTELFALKKSEKTVEILSIIEIQLEKYLPGYQVDPQLKEWLKENFIMLGIGGEDLSENIEFVIDALQLLILRTSLEGLKANTKKPGESLTTALAVKGQEIFSRMAEQVKKGSVDLDKPMAGFAEIEKLNEQKKQIKEDLATILSKQPKGLSASRTKEIKSILKLQDHFLEVNKNYYDLDAEKTKSLIELSKLQIERRDQKISVVKNLIDYVDKEGKTHLLESKAFEKEFDATQNKLKDLKQEQESLNSRLSKVKSKEDNQKIELELKRCQEELTVVNKKIHHLKNLNAAFRLSPIQLQTIIRYIRLEKSAKNAEQARAELQFRLDKLYNFIDQKIRLKAGGETEQAVYEWMKKVIEVKHSLTEIDEKRVKCAYENKAALEPFAELTTHLLGLVGFDKIQDLLTPSMLKLFPSFSESIVKSILDSLQQDLLPPLLFKQLAPLMINARDKEENTKQLRNLTGSPLLGEFCGAISRNALQVLIPSFQDLAEKMVKGIKLRGAEQLSRYAVDDLIQDIKKLIEKKTPASPTSMDLLHLFESVLKKNHIQVPKDLLDQIEAMKITERFENMEPEARKWAHILSPVLLNQKAQSTLNWKENVERISSAIGLDLTKEQRLSLKDQLQGLSKDKFLLNQEYQAAIQKFLVENEIPLSTKQQQLLSEFELVDERRNITQAFSLDWKEIGAEVRDRLNIKLEKEQLQAFESQMKSLNRGRFFSNQEHQENIQSFLAENGIHLSLKQQEILHHLKIVEEQNIVTDVNQLTNSLSGEIYHVFTSTHPAFNNLREVAADQLESLLLKVFVRVVKQNNLPNQPIFDVIANEVNQLIKAASLDNRSSGQDAEKIVKIVLAKRFGIASANDLVEIPELARSAIYEFLQEQFKPFIMIQLEKQSNQEEIKGICQEDKTFIDLSRAVSQTLVQELPRLLVSYQALAEEIIQKLENRQPSPKEIKKLSQALARLKEPDQAGRMPEITSERLVALYGEIILAKEIGALQSLELSAKMEELKIAEKMKGAWFGSTESILKGLSNLFPSLDAQQQEISKELLNLIQNNLSSPHSKELLTEALDSILTKYFLNFARRHRDALKHASPVKIVMNQLLQGAQAEFEKSKEQHWTPKLFTAKALEFLGLDSREALEGFSPMVQSLIFNFVKTKMETVLKETGEGIDKLEKDSPAVQASLIKLLGNADVIHFSNSIGKFVIDMLPHQLGNVAGGQVKVATMVEKALIDTLEPLAKANNEMAQVLLNFLYSPRGDELKEGIGNLVLELSKKEQLPDAKAKAALLIGNFLLKPLQNACSTLLDKAQKEGTKVSVNLGTSILQAAVDHFHIINQAKQEQGGLTNENFVKVAKRLGKLHHAMPKALPNYRPFAKNINAILGGGTGQEQEINDLIASMIREDHDHVSIFSMEKLLDKINEKRGVSRFESVISQINDILAGKLTPSQKTKLTRTLQQLARRESIYGNVMTPASLMKEVNQIVEMTDQEKLNLMESNLDSLIQLEMTRFPNSAISPEQEQMILSPEADLKGKILKEAKAPTELKEKFYKDKSQKLLHVLLPKGQDELDFIPKDLRGAAWSLIEGQIFPMVLPSIVETVLDRDTITSIVTSSLSSLEASLSGEIKAEEEQPLGPLTPEEQALEEAAGSMILEMVDVLEFNPLLRKALKSQTVQDKLKKSLGANLRKQLNEKFIPDTLKSLFKNFALDAEGKPVIKFEVKTEEQKAEARIENEKKLQEVTHKLVDAAFSYPLKSLNFKVKQKWDKLWGDVAKTPKGEVIKPFIERIFDLLFNKIVGSLLYVAAYPFTYLFKLYLDHKRNKVMHILREPLAGQPAEIKDRVHIHEALAFSLLDGIEAALNQDKKSVSTKRVSSNA